MEENKPSLTTTYGDIDSPENAKMVSCWPMSRPHPEDRVWDTSAETKRNLRSGDRVDRSFVYVALALLTIVIGLGFWQYNNIMELPLAERPEAWEDTAMWILMGLLLCFVSSGRS